MSKVIVYSSEAKDGTVRMALHPMDSAPNFCDGHSPKIKFPFRVVYSNYYVDAWCYSCRGTGPDIKNLAGSYVGRPWDRDFWSNFDKEVDQIKAGSEHAAIQWLLLGERL